MGVKGLKTFLERNKQTRHIDIIEEVNKWKSENPEETPIIVIDFCSLTKSHKKKEDYICGGGSEITSSPWNEILKNLKASGCSLMFFSDQRIKDDKISEHSNNSITDMYDRIDDGQTLQEISAEIMDDFDEKTTYRELNVIARRYGEIRYSINEECDLELAQYACRNNAMAVVSNDTDFLIYEGAWRLWWTGDDIKPWIELKATEYIRKDLEKLFGLSRNQLPLVAALMGNQFTREYQNRFSGYRRVEDIANYVRKVGSGRLSDLDIKRIVQDVYKEANESPDKIQLSIRNSLQWYDIRVEPPKLDDELAEEFLQIRINGVDMFRPYMKNMAKTSKISTKLYDLRGSQNGTKAVLLMMDWKRRNVGILRQRFNDDAFEFTIIARSDTNLTSKVTHIEKPIYPDFKVPPLEDLYMPEETDEMKWTILGWAMSLPANLIETIRGFPKDYLVIGTTLYVLVQNGILSELLADGILYTEYKAIVNETEIMNVEYPTVLKSQHVHAAHVYRVVFEQVKENFAVAGFLSLIDCYLNFHGVYYQNLMGKLEKMDSAERDNFIQPIKGYRVYAKDY